MKLKDIQKINSLKHLACYNGILFSVCFCILSACYFIVGFGSYADISIYGFCLICLLFIFSRFCSIFILKDKHLALLIDLAIIIISFIYCIFIGVIPIIKHRAEVLIYEFVFLIMTILTFCYDTMAYGSGFIFSYERIGLLLKRDNNRRLNLVIFTYVIFSLLLSIINIKNCLFLVVPLAFYSLRMSQPKSIKYQRLSLACIGFIVHALTIIYITLIVATLIYLIGSN